jgi:sulfate permease, SulP family
VDFTGLELLGELTEQLESSGVEVHLAEVRGPVRDVLERADWFRRLEADGRVHQNVPRAVAALPVDLNPRPDIR